MKVCQNHPLRGIAGVTLVELMVTVAIVSIGILASIASFQYITQAIQNSKSRTLSNNLAQEQIEKLKNLSYYTLLVTTSTYSDTRFNPSLDYDTGNYPAESVVEGGISFTRATRVDFAYQSGSTTIAAPWTVNDTGLKLITTYIIWQTGSDLHEIEMHNYMANPAANPLNATFSGTVTDTLGGNVAGAIVQVVDNPNWYGTSNSVGYYQFKVSQGSYTMTCSSQGYFSNSTHNYQSILSGQNITVPFTLAKMSSGTATGYIYLDDHLVISQVVATTVTTSGSYEYVELYNPTTAAINIGDNAHNTSPNVVPIFWDHTNNDQMRHMLYISSYVPANSYYLMTNSGNADPATSCAAITIANTSVTPDACWLHRPAPLHAIEQGDAGGVSLGNTDSYTGDLNFTSSNWPSVGSIDSMGWSRSTSGHSAPSNAEENTGIGSANGLSAGEVYIRSTHPGGLNTSYGRAYDSDDNSHDFLDSVGYTNAPKTTTSGTVPPLTGTPATGAYVLFTDPLSSLATCTNTTLSGGYRVCSFTTPSIATGTWMMVVSSGTYYVEVSTIIIQASVSTGVPNGITSPTWLVTGTTNTLLNDATTYALLSGMVTDASNNALSGIVINAGGNTTTTSASGRYFLSAQAGDIQISANYNNANRAYTSESSTLTVVAGVLYDTPTGGGHTWFTLSLGGILKGYMQTGANTPLPGRVAVALSGGNEVGQGVSGTDGYFYIPNMTTGTYTVQPSLDPAEAASPSSTTVTLASTGTATNVSTFTISNALVEIAGQVTIAASSTTITTGVLVLASTNTLTSTNPPPAQRGASGVLCNPCYYMVSSDSTGAYSLMVRNISIPYQVYAWYTTFSGTTPTTVPKGPYSVTVSTAGGHKDISW